MKFVGNILGVVIVGLFFYLSVDLDSKNTTPVKPKTPTYSQFMTCDIGENWSNVNVMMDEWNNMAVDGMSFALGHRIYEGSAEAVGSNQVSWQLFWDTKQKADKFWKSGPSDDFKAWADKHRSVMSCDGEGRRNYAVDLPRPQNKQGEWDGDTELVSVIYQCKYTVTAEDGTVTPMEDKEGGKSALKAMYSEFMDYVDEQDKNASWHIWSKSGKRGPYNFGVYTHSGENPDPYMDYDFYWMNYYENDEEARARLNAWVETGGDLQEKFDEFSTCEQNLIYSNSYVLYPDLVNE
jgi:hypothetical protein|tara:strand:- start:369 stop:1247 length:879 start_codon:yes stop_codon:yes gene_type:complete